MRLRTRLTLAFALIAIAPAVLVAWVTLSTVRSSFEAMLEKRLDDVEALLRAEIEHRAVDIERSVAALSSTTPAITRLARDVSRGSVDEASALPVAEELMAARRELGALFLLDGEGRVLSSGHLPARSGARNLELVRLSTELPGEPTLQWIEVRTDLGVERALAMLVGRPAGDAGSPRSSLHVVGGKMLDESFLGRLRSLTGADVRLLLDAEEESLEQDRENQRVRRVSMTDGEAADGALVEFAVSEDELARAKMGILSALGASALLVVVAAALLGAFLASRITRPVDALAEGAARISRGDYQPVEEAGSTKEISTLMDAFNSMIVEIRASHERIAAAERVAAWQGIARRLAHEIKNPLTPIAMSIETLQRTRKKRHPDFEEIFDESTAAILEEVEALKRIVSEFSDFARLPAPALEEVRPEDLVEGALALFPEPPQDVEIRQEIEPGLPAVMADRSQMGQVLLNLVTNALAALEESGAEGGSIVLRAVMDPRGGAVTIEVEDDGPGISAEDRTEIFTPYFTTKESGTGLGLAICHRIIDEHGGRITVDSEPGEGTLFKLTLPIGS